MTLNATEVVTGQEGGKPSGDVLLLILDNRGGLVNEENKHMIRQTRAMTFAMIEPIFELRVSKITAWNYGISFFYYSGP